MHVTVTSVRLTRAFLRGLLAELATPAPLLLDRFTDADGTALAAHTMDVGGGWTPNSGSTAQIQANRYADQSGGGHTADAGRSDCTVRAVYVCPAAGAVDAGLILRYSNALNHWLLLLENPGQSVALYELVGGSIISRANVAGVFLGMAVELGAVLSGDTIAGSLSGVPKLSYAFATHNNDKTRFGIRNYRSGEYQQVPADDFEARPL